MLITYQNILKLLIICIEPFKFLKLNLGVIIYITILEFIKVFRPAHSVEKEARLIAGSPGGPGRCTLCAENVLTL